MTEPAERALQRLLESVRQCAVCAPHLPFPTRPVLRVSATARLLIVGQAPGRRVHETGIPWNDPSGDRLRAWLHLDRETFYDTARIAIVPAGLCYPGSATRGDLPPRPECAPLWHPPLLNTMPRLRLILLVGSHAQAYYLGPRRKPTLADTVQAFADYLPRYFPLPHPSPRNHRWFQSHPWLDTVVLPAARRIVREVLARRASDR